MFKYIVIEQSNEKLLINFYWKQLELLPLWSFCVSRLNTYIPLKDIPESTNLNPVQ